MEIESDVPMPDDGRKKWPFSEMQIQQSVAFSNKIDYAKALAAAHTYGGKNPEKRFSGKWDADQGIGRIWRIE